MTLDLRDSTLDLEDRAPQLGSVVDFSMVIVVFFPRTGGNFPFQMDFFLWLVNGG